MALEVLKVLASTVVKYFLISLEIEVPSLLIALPISLKFNLEELVNKSCNLIRSTLVNFFDIFSVLHILSQLN